MKFFIKIGLLMLLILLVLTACKIEVNSPQSARDDNYGVGESIQSSDTLEKQQQEGLSQAGTGDAVYSQLTLKKGIMVLSVDFSKGQRFSIKILDNDGTVVATVSKNQASYKGQRTIQVPKDGDNYIVEIQSDGSWEVKLLSTVKK
ncbi:hypothetical protein HMPREF9495_01321 [Enterococcus mundtii QU 25]|uniref:hypothetical protein n=1 Tax=Enterococcus mundtii TaxID=53346 RepID=UPI0003C566A8|nr:hypothetical protein [Enterococcus mundtii]BAO07834.1 hypothetical protein HMPREF9495_01321 [Enterococcus mundtii QU 25]